MAAIAALASPLAQAQEPIRLIVPYPPGGPLDITARALAERVRDTLGVVVIENKAGAGGNIGADAVAKAAPDGMTIGLAATATHAVNPWLYARMPYDAARDFAGITQMVRVPNVLVMNAARAEQLKIHSVADLIAYAKSHPGKLNYGSGGNGSAGHLASEMLKQRAGIFALHVPYRGANPAQLALLSGEVDFNIDNLAAAAPNIRAGKLKALAVTSLEPSPLLPGVPALSRTFPGFAIDTWWGLVAPAGTPRPVLDKLNKAFTQALAAPETRARFELLMAEPVASAPADFDKFMAAERAKYQPVVKASGAKVD
nr:tripartite tricarboxylate transporter substrate binding protein [Delftia sp. PS-11]KAJ8745391.1 tripartite tricarboxylate transporter substrate binding protein [Delftia sp. PS-11]